MLSFIINVYVTCHLLEIFGEDNIVYLQQDLLHQPYQDQAFLLLIKAGGESPPSIYNLDSPNGNKSYVV